MNFQQNHNNSLSFLQQTNSIKAILFIHTILPNYYKRFTLFLEYLLDQIVERGFL